MKNQFTIATNIKEVKRANLLLRAMWSKIREDFGGCNWLFSPFTNREKRTIQFGQFTTDKKFKGSIEVQLTYENKGGIKSISFSNREEDISLLEVSLNSIVESFEDNMEEKSMSTTIEMNLPIAKYKGKNILIRPISDYQSELVFKVRGYDLKDCQFVAKKKLDNVINLLAATIWHTVKFSPNHNKKKKIEKTIEENVFSESLKFESADDHLVKNEMYHLPKRTLSLIDTILEEDEYTTEDKKLIDASNLFHSALKIESLRNEFSINNISQYEILITHYMSALEVLSFNEAEVLKCKECNQNIFSISKRVKGLLQDVFSKKGENYYVKRLHGLYTDRSKFLHIGKYLSNQAYLNVSIPQLNKTGDLIDYQYIYDGGGIKYYIGRCFEYHLKEKKNS